MTALALTKDQANAVFDVLAQHVGAPESLRDQFLYHETDGCREFRFQGLLGFGGKFYVTADRWYVDCYPEDRAPERVVLIESANKALAALREEAGQP